MHKKLKERKNMMNENAPGKKREETSDIDIREIAEYHKKVKEEFPNGIPIGITLENLKVNYPSLYKDMMDNGGDADPFRGYIPGVFDYLARAKTEEECLEIIDYLEAKGELEPELAEELRRQTREEGPESFGTREPGYYDTFIRRRS